LNTAYLRTKMRIFFISLAIFLFTFTSCKKNESYKTEVFLNNSSKLKVEEIKKNFGVGVVNSDRLRLRSLNDLHSKTLRYLDKGAIVTILAKDNNRVRIDEIEDYWYNVEYEGIKGWIFGYYADIYSSLEDAKYGSSKYLNDNPADKFTQTSSGYYEDAINKNLFFLLNGKIYQVIDGKKGNAKFIKTQTGLKVINFFFNETADKIYYIASPLKSSNDYGNLYLYDISSDENRVIHKSVYALSINSKDHRSIILTSKKDKSKTFWVLKYFDMKNFETIGDILFLPKADPPLEDATDDIFSLTLKRELGSLVYLEWDRKKNFLYFKPPEENQTYLISLSNNDSIKIDLEKRNTFDIDSSRYLAINSEEDGWGKNLYIITMKDRISGIEKEIIRSELYPINFCMSPRQIYIAISMISMKEVINGCFPSSIYVLSLSTYSLAPISTDGNSYQPKWSPTLLK